MFAIREGIIGLKRNGVVSLIAIGVIFFSLLLFSIFLVITFNLFGIVRYAQSKVEINAFLRDDIPQDSLISLEEKIKKISGVKSVQYVSREDALKELKKEMGNIQELLEALETNPLPASFKIKLDEGYHTLKEIENISKKIAVFKEIEDVSFGKKFLTRLDMIVKIMFFFDLLIGFVISVASIFVVSNTIRLTVISRKDSIEIMQLVGATERMVKAPFIIEGVIEGFLGSILSVILVYAIFIITRKYFEVYFPPIYVLTGIVFFGIILGIIGSRNAVNAYLSGGNI